MRNLKKFLALVLATMMLLSVAVFSVNAADEADYTDAANHLAALQVMKGNENGDLMLDQGVTRYQAALFFVQALTGETDVAYWNAEKQSAYFADVPEYGTAIDHAYGINLIKGRGNGVYGYNDAITYQDMLVMSVRALGYETEGMAYPYGYILAAQKLGLTENVAQVNYKAALTRGETAQIIWDMLDTEVAEFDPLNDKLLYPGDEESSLTFTLTGKKIERTKLIVDSGLAGAQLTGFVTGFEEADEEDEESFDTLFVDVTIVDKKAETANVEPFEFKAADFGIDAETPVVSYLGLPVEFFINENELDQADYNDGDIAIVSANFPTYTVVNNISDAGDVKYVETTTNNYLSLGGEKFTENKYDFVVREFGASGWTISDIDLSAIFAYDSKEGYTGTDNTFASVAYRVTDVVNVYVDDKATVETEDDVVLAEKTVVEILYTPLTFGQYNVREINDNEYTVVAIYKNDKAENLDGVNTNFVEYLVNKIGTATHKVDINTKSISNTKGEAALNVTLEGEAVEAGDFMFYAYNPVDNVLTIAKNCGTFETGRLTAKNNKAETVKIDGTSYEFGFKGIYNADFGTAFDSYDVQGEYIANLKSGMDNVKYLLVDGQIVYMEACETDDEDSVFPFAVIGGAAELVELLELDDEDELAELLTSGLYIEDGVVKVAMLNLTTGEWELASVSTFAAEWDDEDKEFVKEYDLAEGAKYYDITGNEEKYGYVEIFAGLKGLVAIVEEADGVYTLAQNEADFFATTNGEGGIKFYDNSPKTSAVCVDPEDDTVTARIELTDDSVVVLVANGVIGARTGVQVADASINADGTFYSTNSDLIVFVTDTTIDVANWEGVKANADDNYFITTVDTTVEVEAGETEEDPYVVTLTNLYDMKAQAMIEELVIEMDDITDADNKAIVELDAVNTILYKNAKEEVKVTTKTIADVIVEVVNDNEDGFEYAVVDAADFAWESADTIYIKGAVENGEVVNVNATVITLNMIESDEEFDLTGVVSAKDFTEGDEADDVEIFVNEESKIKWAYILDTELVNEITEPTEGVLDDYIVELLGENVLAPLADAAADDFTDAVEITVELTIAYDYDDETGDVNLIVYKLLK